LQLQVQEEEEEEDEQVWGGRAPIDRIVENDAHGVVF
jgi:hypothetical protein